jgi:hypothetical protein
VAKNLSLSQYLATYGSSMCICYKHVLFVALPNRLTFATSVMSNLFRLYSRSTYCSSSFSASMQHLTKSLRTVNCSYRIAAPKLWNSLPLTFDPFLLAPLHHLPFTRSPALSLLSPVLFSPPKLKPTS